MKIKILCYSFFFLFFFVDYKKIGTCNEPPLPRRKKCPELAYKTHEFINCEQQPPTTTSFRNDINSVNRARVSLNNFSFFRNVYIPSSFKFRKIVYGNFSFSFKSKKKKNKLV